MAVHPQREFLLVDHALGVGICLGAVLSVFLQENGSAGTTTDLVQR